MTWWHQLSNCWPSFCRHMSSQGHNEWKSHNVNNTCCYHWPLIDPMAKASDCTLRTYTHPRCFNLFVLCHGKIIFLTKIRILNGLLFVSTTLLAAGDHYRDLKIVVTKRTIGFDIRLQTSGKYPCGIPNGCGKFGVLFFSFPNRITEEWDWRQWKY